ncbi:hypothetical protein DL95DRAFT_460065 [Leptodontidium sp. 2 PMI_412]|nr:hypothetical protein DL95DRAFT_460065 [Leptodontidium sp. 2 PMI_412]
MDSLLLRPAKQEKLGWRRLADAYIASPPDISSFNQANLPCSDDRSSTQPKPTPVVAEEGDVSRHEPSAVPKHPPHTDVISAEDHDMCHQRFNYEMKALNTRFQRAFQEAVKAKLDADRQEKNHAREIRRLKELVDELRMLRSAYEKLQIENKALKKKATAPQASIEPLLVETRTLQASITTLQSGIDDLKTELEASKSQAQQQAQSMETLSELCTQRLADYTLKQSNALSRKEKVISLEK